MGFTRGFIEFERIEQPHVSVEERVKSFCEIYGTLTDEQAKIQAGRLLDPKRAGSYNQAIMELGALQCVPRRPDCAVCPFCKCAYRS